MNPSRTNYIYHRGTKCHDYPEPTCSFVQIKVYSKLLEIILYEATLNTIYSFYILFAKIDRMLTLHCLKVAVAEDFYLQFWSEDILSLFNFCSFLYQCTWLYKKVHFIFSRILNLLLVEFWKVRRLWLKKAQILTVQYWHRKSSSN